MNTIVQKVVLLASQLVNAIDVHRTQGCFSSTGKYWGVP